MKKTPLYQNHIDLGAKMGPFAGYDMPLYYKDGALKEHEWVRAHAGLFDVSHMGQVIVEGPAAMEFVHKICPSDFTNAPDGRAKYTVLTNEKGGIIDDMIVTRLAEDRFFIVINAGRKDVDLEWMKQQLLDGARMDVLDDRALIAIQGKAAENAVKAVLGFDCSSQPYMWFEEYTYEGEAVYVSRLGYTGEDGFELSVPAALAPSVWDALIANDSVAPAGLASRDTLRLEMGYPLYGHDLDESISPIEAGLGWVVSKNNDSFYGHDIVREQQQSGTARTRVGIMLTDKGIAREGAEILSADGDQVLGTLTSGGFSPVLQKGIGQGYVEAGSVSEGDTVLVKVRGRELAAEVTGLSFVKAGTKSMKKAA